MCCQNQTVCHCSLDLSAICLQLSLHHSCITLRARPQYPSPSLLRTCQTNTLLLLGELRNSINATVTCVLLHLDSSHCTQTSAFWTVPAPTLVKVMKMIVRHEQPTGQMSFRAVLYQIFFANTRTSGISLHFPFVISNVSKIK